MLEGIIFDLDGVVIDSHPIHKKAWRKFLASVGKQVSEQDLDFVMDGGKKEDILRHFLGNLSDEEVRVYGQRKEMLFREEALEFSPVDGFPEFLQQLRRAGVPMGLASSGSRRRVRYILERMGLDRDFEVVITGDDVPSGKPDPTIFLRAANGLHRAPPGLLVVEDAVSGVEAAKRAGMRCLGIASDGRTQLLLDAGADHVVPNFVGLSVDFLHTIGNGHR